MFLALKENTLHNTLHNLVTVHLGDYILTLQ